MTVNMCSWINIPPHRTQSLVVRSYAIVCAVGLAVMISWRLYHGSLPTFDDLELTEAGERAPVLSFS
jgi:hypothetical protein